MAASFEDFKPEIENHLRYLKAAVKPESKETGEVIDRLAEYAANWPSRKTSRTLSDDSRSAMAKYSRGGIRSNSFKDVETFI